MLAHLPPFQRQAVALALYRMLTGPAFDVCVVRDALAVAGLAPPRASVEALRLLHTSRYDEMPDGLHAALVNETLALFSGRPLLGTGALRDLAGLAGLDTAGVPSLAAAEA